MKLVEFTVKWIGNYTAEDIQVYEISYGEDRDKWPKTDETSLILIDVNSILRVNPNDDPTCTVVELINARAYSICMTYEEFKIALQNLGVEIYSHAV